MFINLIAYKPLLLVGVFILKESHRLFFEDHDLDFEYETVIRREINSNGKSRAFINDTPVLVHTLSLFGKQIIEIYQNVISFDELSHSMFCFLPAIEVIVFELIK